MKKIFLFGLLALAGWKGYQHFFTANTAAGGLAFAESRVEPPMPAETQYSAAASTQAFKCDGRTHCSHMTSRAEAEYFIRHCPNTKMDGDHDGVPCESDSRF
ncbi:MAG: excalibur calcium-binding domain-containing protein [Pseudoxanthomonas sp.]